MSKLDLVGWTLYGFAFGGYAVAVGVRTLTAILASLDANVELDLADVS